MNSISRMEKVVHYHSQFFILKINSFSFIKKRTSQVHSEKKKEINTYLLLCREMVYVGNL